LKNSLCITLTDVKGSRQFGLSRQKLLRIFISVFTLLLMLIVYPVWLNHQNGSLESGNQALVSRQAELVEQTTALALKHEALSESLTAKSAAFELGREQFDLLVKQINYQGPDILEDADRFALLSNQIAFKQMVLQLLPNGRPVNYDRVSSSFGRRMHPFLKTNYQHKGIDVHSNVGTPVIATADGVVTSLQYTKDGFGKLIKITHGMGFTTYYGHLKTISVDARQFVNKGDVIGYSGNTGRSTGPHLHYEVRFGLVPLDPADFILLTLNNFDQQLEKIEEIPWASLMASMQRLVAIKPQRLSPKIATSTENSILTVACTSTVGCQETSSALTASSLANPVTLMAK
jgi:murein DD-endopeptidase MepM/ murein hydrolase activator NlpD